MNIYFKIRKISTVFNNISLNFLIFSAILRPFYTLYLFMCTGYSNEKLFSNGNWQSSLSIKAVPPWTPPPLHCLKTGAPIFWAASSIASALEFNFWCLCFCFYSKKETETATDTELRQNEEPMNFLGVEMLLKFTRTRTYTLVIFIDARVNVITIKFIKIQMYCAQI